MTLDPFRTAELRSAVLNAWTQSPSRLREDSNTEEDHAHGYYRDRVVVELAQNAADAAARAGVPGCLLLALLHDGTTTRLVAANTGSGIDADGVASLSSLRASAKTDPCTETDDDTKTDDDTGTTHAPQTVGRFGVGFAAVRSVSDDITVASRDGGVQFSLTRTHDAIATIPALSARGAARSASAAILRLPFPARAHTPHPERTSPLDLNSYDTVVTLILRDDDAVTAVRAQLAAIDDALLLALPALASVQIDDGQHPREVRDAASRWIALTRTGVLQHELLADRPLEERRRTTWSLTWAYPRSPEARVAHQVVHAPTPTDEPLSLPALLIASFPLDPSRRHVAEGPLTQFLVRKAGQAYADLAREVTEPLDLVPSGLPGGRLDADLCDAAVTAMQATPVFAGRTAADTVVIDADVRPALVHALSPTGLGVVPVRRDRLNAARRLGVQVLSLADVIDALPAGLAPAQWHDLYAALEPHADDDRAVREALTAILVPCVDGSTARGPRGLVMPRGRRTPVLDGLRVVHPEAAHPLLNRLGAIPDDDPAILALAAVERAVYEATDALTDAELTAIELTVPGAGDGAGPADVAAVLVLVAGVVAEQHVTPEDLPGWLSGIPLPSDEGTWQRADELSWPGSWAHQHLDLPAVAPLLIPGEPLTADVARAVGVRFELSVRLVEHETSQADDDTIAGWADYDDYLCAVLGENQEVGTIPTITDLDVVDDGSWSAVLDLVLREPDLYRAVVATVRAQGTTREALSYAAWYLRDVFGAPWSSADALAAVLPDQPSELADVQDTGLLRALGSVTSSDDLGQLLAAPDPAAWESFLNGLPDVGTPIPLQVASAVWTALEVASAAGLELDPPDVVIALQALTPRVVLADDTTVTHEPMWAQTRAVVPATNAQAAREIATALDCDVADPSGVVLQGDPDAPATHPDGAPAPHEEAREIPSWIATLVHGIPTHWTEHAELSADGRDVDWWIGADQSVHVRRGAPASALAAACAQAAGSWKDRHLIELALRDGTRHAELAVARAWERRERSPVSTRNDL